MRVENVKDPADHIPAVLERVRPEYLTKTYQVLVCTHVGTQGNPRALCMHLHVYVYVHVHVYSRILSRTYLLGEKFCLEALCLNWWILRTSCTVLVTVYSLITRNLFGGEGDKL